MVSRLAVSVEKRGYEPLIFLQLEIFSFGRSGNVALSNHALQLRP